MAYHFMTPRFALGRTVATPGAIGLNIDLEYFLRRHHCGDWGDLDDGDKEANEHAVIQGGRILSLYQISEETRIFVITEHDRSSTCIMLPMEY